MYQTNVKKRDVMVITARDIMNAPKGHPPRMGGCGVHRNKKKNPPRVNNRRDSSL